MWTMFVLAITFCSPPGGRRNSILPSPTVEHCCQKTGSCHRWSWRFPRFMRTRSTGWGHVSNEHLYWTVSSMELVCLLNLHLTLFYLTFFKNFILRALLVILVPSYAVEAACFVWRYFYKILKLYFCICHVHECMKTIVILFYQRLIRSLKEWLDLAHWVYLV